MPLALIHAAQTQAAQALATSYTRSVSTGNQLYRQRKHRQPVIQAAKAQAASYTGSASTGNKLYREPKTHATSYTGSPSTGNQF